MKFLELNIENFLVLTEAKIKLADRGLVLVQGENAEDSSANSNGAGKSSVADALCWALYGVTARGESGDQIVNNKAGKGTRVEVKVDDDGTVYRVVRHRKHKTGKNALHVFVDDGLTGEKDLTKGTDKLTQDMVEKLIGASLEVFTGSIYAGQEKMPDLPSLTDKMLKVLIEEAAGVNQLEAAYTAARESARVAKIDLDGASRLLENHQMQLAAAEQQRDAAVQGETAWVAQREAKIQQLTDDVRNRIIPAAKQLATEAPQAEIDRLTAEIAAVDQKIASVGQEQVELQRLEGVLNAARMTEAGTLNDIKTLTTHVANAKARHEQSQHKLGCPCTSCGRPLTEQEVGNVIQNAADEVKSWEKILEGKQTALKPHQDAVSASLSAVDAFKVTLTDVSKEVALRSSLEAQRKLLTDKDAMRLQYVNLAKTTMDQIKALQAEASPFVGQIATLQVRVDQIRKQIADASGEVAVKKERFELESEVVRVFAPSGVRARVLDEVTPYLNAQTSKYLSIMSDGNISAEWSTLTVNKSGEVKEKFAIDVSSLVSAKTFKGLSGGEKRKVRISTALALQDLVSTRASKPIDLFVGDEIDDALDASGLERLMVILDEKAKERGTVMVISHNSLRDEIPQVMLVQRTASGETKILESAA